MLYPGIYPAQPTELPQLAQCSCTLAVPYPAFLPGLLLRFSRILSQVCVCSDTRALIQPLLSVSAKERNAAWWIAVINLGCLCRGTLPLDLAYWTENLLVYFWFGIESDLGLTESLVKPAKIFLCVLMYVKVCTRIKEMNLKYCMVFIWESLSPWNPEAEGVSQLRDNKQLLLVPWMMVLYFMMAGTTWEMRKTKFYLMCEMSWGQVSYTISMSNKKDWLTETVHF